MKEYIKQLTSIELSEYQQSQFDTLATMLLENNANFNLTAITQPEAIRVKHFIDCAVGVNYISKCASVLDVGAGGGFPSFVLAILRPDIKLTILDSNLKKIDYCRVVAKQLNVNVNLMCGRVENRSLITKRYDYAVARAVAETDILLEYMAYTVNIGGHIILYKGIQQQSYDDVATKLGLNRAQVYEYNLPNDYGQRRLLIYTKIKPTPPQYPRSNAAIRKSPLGAGK
ncbi:MAG: 16S rRNA (guanine(527)-N(7))-methyltransferase RsmG [Clostridia bacterium]|nr:16S rRNA (guanine(527)-N(7))-methyltransferase RsmG [Clostridia bacterium]